jgi:hypothetical protein
VLHPAPIAHVVRDANRAVFTYFYYEEEPKSLARSRNDIAAVIAIIPASISQSIIS